MTQTLQTPAQPGEAAPDFKVSAVQTEGMISLADYRSRAPLLLGLFTGLYCPFCRRAIAQMAATSEKLKPLGVESLAIVATELDNARLYFKFRPTRLTLGADPQLTTHRSYRVPRPEPTPELMSMVEKIRVNPTGELPEPLPIPSAAAALDKLDGFQRTATDQLEAAAHFTQMKGQFLIDRDGIVRWANIECAKEGLADFGRFPTHDELLTAARIVTE
ncbi:MAG: alkyl hydroperoxide reductase [Blastocatellia bacterium]|nr:MAG: alkyl hydroperoxide reductase [Blastocatellia bacterium]